MFSLCSDLKNIIVDLDSLSSYLQKVEFEDALTKISNKYNLYCVSSGIFSFPKFNTVMCNLRDPLAISAFIISKEINPVNTVIIAGSTSPNELAHSFNISTILLTEDDKLQLNENNKHLPDTILNVEYLIELLINEKKVGYFNELSIGKVGGIGSVYHIGEIKHQIFGEIKADLMFAGRYFVYDDSRHYTHCLSTMISRLKHFKSYAINEMAYCLDVNITLTQDCGNIDIITVVPAKPGCENHLDLVINHEKLNNHRSKIDSDLLYTVRNYQKQKRAGSFYDRAINVLDAFDSRRPISGHVLLIDDVLTSGSTTMECARVLYKYGASKVTVLPLSIMQSNSNAPEHKKILDNFGMEFRLNFNTSNGEPFWVASDGVFLNFHEGKKRYLSQFTYKDFELELPF
jgi:predicted amidophosphoribosyltransferase